MKETYKVQQDKLIEQLQDQQTLLEPLESVLKLVQELDQDLPPEPEPQEDKKAVFGNKRLSQLSKTEDK